MSHPSNQNREINIGATEKQRLAWSVWNDEITDDLVYGGYAGGGKSMLAGLVLTGTALQYPGCKQFLGRKELKNLMGTSYITLTQKVFPLYGLQREKDWKLDGKNSVIYFINPKTQQFDDFSSRIDLLDLKYEPSDPLFDRFGSAEYTRGWIEEASEVSFKAYDVLKTRIGRWMNKELGIKGKLGLSLNPSQDWPYRIFYDPWKKAGKPLDINKPLVSIRAVVDGAVIERKFVFVPASPGDNPFTAGEYMKTLATISDPGLRARLRDGDWEYTSASDTLFDAASIADLFTVSVERSNDLFLTVDAARLGGDEIVLTHWRGWDAFKIDRYTMLRTPDTAERIRTAIDTYGIPRERVLIDEDGVGGGVLDLVPGCQGFHGGAAPFGRIVERDGMGTEIRSIKENYENLKTQCVYHLAEKVKARKVSVSEPDLTTRERIAQDLPQFKRRDADKSDRLKITKKEDMKMALGRSPDCGDTLMMRSYFDVRIREEQYQGNMGTVTVSIKDYTI